AAWRGGVGHAGPDAGTHLGAIAVVAAAALLVAVGGAARDARGAQGVLAERFAKRLLGRGLLGGFFLGFLFGGRFPGGFFLGLFLGSRLLCGSLLGGILSRRGFLFCSGLLGDRLFGCGLLGGGFLGRRFLGRGLLGSAFFRRLAFLFEPLLFFQFGQPTFFFQARL